MNILGIETSCDETACAVVEDGVTARSNIISSQVNIHAQFGGVVPELASRAHTKNILPVLERALREAGADLNAIDAFAVTQGPGLIGSLLVGVEMAKSLSFVLSARQAGRQKPLIATNHLAAHLYAPFICLERVFQNDAHPPDLNYPYLGLVVSGGHTSLIIVHPPMQRGGVRYEPIGCTLDDAAGEAFDKVANLLGLGYPGGPIIDRLAEDGDPQAIRFTRPLCDSDDYNFSFSGLKTAVLRYVKETGKERILGDVRHVRDLVASFQEAVVDSLLIKTQRAVRDRGLRNIVICGGVACNRRLRKRAAEVFAGSHVVFPPPILCTDNAAMTAGLAFHYYQHGRCAALSLNADAHLPLDNGG
jgi:N6-L-threonylcarbamoyladenine synthase